MIFGKMLADNFSDSRRIRKENEFFSEMMSDVNDSWKTNKVMFVLRGLYRK